MAYLFWQLLLHWEPLGLRNKNGSTPMQKSDRYSSQNLSPDTRGVALVHTALIEAGEGAAGEARIADLVELLLCAMKAM